MNYRDATDCFGQPQASENPTRGGTHIIWPWTVKDCKAQLLANAAAWDVAVKAGGCTSDQLASWEAFYAPLVAFAKEDVSIWGLGSQMDRCQSWEDALYTWQTGMKASCQNIAAPVINPNPYVAPSPWIDVAKWTAIAAVTIGGAYGVGRVVTLIPSAEMRERERRRQRVAARREKEAALPPKE